MAKHTLAFSSRLDYFSPKLVQEGWKNLPLIDRVVGSMKFTVNNQEWELVLVNPNSKELMRSNGSITIGMTDNTQKKVFINNRLNDYMFDKCLAHELCHVYAFSFDYFMDIQTEEIVADFFSLFGRSMVYMLDDLVGILKKAYIA